MTIFHLLDLTGLGYNTFNNLVQKMIIVFSDNGSAEGG